MVQLDQHVTSHSTSLYMSSELSYSYSGEEENTTYRNIEYMSTGQTHVRVVWDFIPALASKVYLAPSLT